MNICNKVWHWHLVLIVAKCIVNTGKPSTNNVPCCVLIVAKCIVNLSIKCTITGSEFVLIVAKCIVNAVLYLSLL